MSDDITAAEAGRIADRILGEEARDDVSAAIQDALERDPNVLTEPSAWEEYIRAVGETG